MVVAKLSELLSREGYTISAANEKWVRFENDMGPNWDLMNNCFLMAGTDVLDCNLNGRSLEEPQKLTARYKCLVHGTGYIKELYIPEQARKLEDNLELDGDIHIGTLKTIRDTSIRLGKIGVVTIDRLEVKGSLEESMILLGYPGTKVKELRLIDVFPIIGAADIKFSSDEVARICSDRPVRVTDNGWHLLRMTNKDAGYYFRNEFVDMVKLEGEQITEALKLLGERVQTWLGWHNMKFSWVYDGREVC